VGYAKSTLKRLKEPEPAVRLFLDAAAGLGPKMGPVLVQLSPRQGVDVGRLNEALAAFPRSMLVAVEFRHPSWETPEIRRTLERHGAALCLADRGVQLVTPDWRTSVWGYIRFHGGDDRPPGAYRRRSLARWAERICDQWTAREDVYVYFNNDAHGCALRDAITLTSALTNAGREVTRVSARQEVHVG
jgi:uncharacterized protein YecE (DUF72 family)